MPRLRNSTKGTYVTVALMPKVLERLDFMANTMSLQRSAVVTLALNLLWAQEQEKDEYQKFEEGLEASVVAE
jgi:predicted transcriptional regulator